MYRDPDYEDWELLDRSELQESQELRGLQGVQGVQRLQRLREPQKSQDPSNHMSFDKMKPPKKKERTCTKQDEKNILMNVFNQTPSPPKQVILELIEKLGQNWTECRVKTWFGNRRSMTPKKTKLIINKHKLHTKKKDKAYLWGMYSNQTLFKESGVEEAMYHLHWTRKRVIQYRANIGKILRKKCN